MQVLASIAGSTQTTRWAGVPTDIPSYVSTATQSLLSFYNDFGIAGFDIDYEESIAPNGNTDQTWLQAWCQIIVNLKQVICTCGCCSASR